MKKNKMSLTTELDLTREGTAEMTRWCILIALHQSFGIGAAAAEQRFWPGRKSWGRRVWMWP